MATRLRGILFDVMVGRRSLEQAIEADEAVRSAARVYPAMRLLALAAARDAASSGQVVLHLAEFERLRHDAAESTRAAADETCGSAATQGRGRFQRHPQGHD